MADLKEIVQMLRVLDDSCKGESIQWVAQIAGDAIENLLEENSLLRTVNGLQAKIIKHMETVMQANGLPTPLRNADRITRFTPSCKLCKHDPPEHKWPCVDCDMRYHDRAEPKEGAE